ncbi:MAG TPA: thioredoxin family protein [Pseudoxanthomonas sp.]|nr:thioredoxin family protein [Pseudoxanthomonas sp.]
MPFQPTFDEPQPTRAQVESLPGLVVLEFGTPWCGFCQNAQPLLQAALAARQDIRHIKVEDGRGRPLGRAFGVKLWPTVVVLCDGREVSRLVRPTRRQELDDAFGVDP